MVASKSSANREFTRRASTVVSEDLEGDPNDLTDVRILRAIPGDWYIPFDKPNTRWQKITVVDNLWVEFKPFEEESFTVKTTPSDVNPGFLEDKITGEAGTDVRVDNERFLAIDARRIAFFFGGNG